MFKGRQLLIATKHAKQMVMASILEKSLGVITYTPELFDTDVLGTFTGEVERTDDPLTTLRKKCSLAAEQFNYDLVVASEGSFGPHPTLFFASADDELIMCLDTKNNLEIVARELSVETNFNGSIITTTDQLDAFADKVLFPEHALILRDAKHSNKTIIKGITDRDTLYKAFNEIIAKYGTAYAETDMRAMYNPGRMRVIEAATLQLVKKMQSLCPQCSTPGFDVTSATRGLPCGFCHTPTRSVLSYTYSCVKCNFTQEEMYPDKKLFEEQMYCDVCNP